MGWHEWGLFGGLGVRVGGLVCGEGCMHGVVGLRVRTCLWYYIVVRAWPIGMNSEETRPMVH